MKLLSSMEQAGIRRFLNITWPMLRPTTFFLVVTGIVNSFAVFEQVNILTSGSAAKPHYNGGTPDLPPEDFWNLKSDMPCHGGIAVSIFTDCYDACIQVWQQRPRYRCFIGGKI